MPKRKCKKRGLKPMTDQQKLVVQLIFDGVKINDIASRMGVHRSTIWRWSRRPDFKKEYNRLYAGWKSDIRKTIRSRFHTPESRAAKRKLKKLETAIEEAGSRGDMAELNRLSREYDKAFNAAYFLGYSPFEYLKYTQKLTGRKKPAKRTRYITEVVR